MGMIVNCDGDDPVKEVLRGSIRARRQAKPNRELAAALLTLREVESISVSIENIGKVMRDASNFIKTSIVHPSQLTPAFMKERNDILDRLREATK